MAEQERKENTIFQVAENLEIHIKEVQPADLNPVQQWMYDEEWTNISLTELKLWRDIYPQCFYGAYDKNGDIICHLFARALAPGTTLVGMFITRPDLRSKGVGTKLIQHVLNKHENCVLLSVQGKEEFYEKRGLKQTGDTMIRMYGMAQKLPVAKDMDSNKQVISFHGNVNLLKRVLDYDNNSHGMDRVELLRFYSYSSDYICLCTGGENIAGFIVLRISNNTAKIIAFCADSPKIAEALLISAILQCQNKEFSVSFPSQNKDQGYNLFRSLFCEPKDYFEGTFMSKTGIIDDKVDWNKVYGATELDFMAFV